MSKVVKRMMIDSIQREVGQYRELVVIDASKVDGISANKMRTALREKNIRLLGVKNAVARKALAEIGIGGAGSILSGASTIAFGSQDIVSLTREMVACVKGVKGLEIRGGAIGDSPLTANDVESLSKSPGREELLSGICGLILAPGASLAGLFGAPAGKIVSQVATRAED